ncbi:MAG: hypothetical protein QW327_05445 [Candidatus Odinarchaeota archaeon]
MQEPPFILFPTIIGVTILWLAATVYMYYQSRSGFNTLTKSFITLSLTITIAMPLLTTELFYPVTSPVYATANLIYTVLILIGVLTLIYGMAKIYFNPANVKTGLLIIIVCATIFIFKFYDYLDWTVTGLPNAELSLTIANTLFSLVVISLVIVAGAAHRKTQTPLLKAKLELLIIAVTCLLIEVLIISIPGNQLYPYRFVTGLALIIPFTILGAMAVTYKHKESLQLISLETGKLLSLNQSDERITALLLKHTSKENICEYYDPTLKSKCKLDPSSYKIEDCKGVKYRRGLICSKILEYERKTGK